jgi:hypothetical protein
MEQKEQSEILPDPFIGDASPVARDTESFDETTNVPVQEKSHDYLPDESPPIRVVRNLLYDGAERGRSLDRQGSPGIGQSTDPVPMQRISKGNPFGEDAQASPQAPSQVTGGYTTPLIR